MAESLIEGDKKSPKYVALLTLGALGVVYGDIGTSPLYALRESFAVADLACAHAKRSNGARGPW